MSYKYSYPKQVDKSSIGLKKSKVNHLWITKKNKISCRSCIIDNQRPASWDDKNFKNSGRLIIHSF